MVSTFAPRRWIQQWIGRRIPPQQEVLLDRRNIFVLPTAEGLWFGLLTFALLMCAINYQNSLVFLLAFLLGSLFVLVILQTFANLSGLRVRRLGDTPAEAGNLAEFRVQLSSTRGACIGLRVGWPNYRLKACDVHPHEPLTLRLHLPTEKRGRLRPARLLIESSFPLTLVRAWTWVDLDLETLVYPRPRYGPEVPVEGAGDSVGQAAGGLADQELDHLREYTPGDALNRIVWQRYARSGDLYTRAFSGDGSGQVWLDIANAPAADIETALGVMAGWVHRCEQEELPYGLRLEGLELPPRRGPIHRAQVLGALAVYRL